jgi:phage terminase large subunit-like protein
LHTSKLAGRLKEAKSQGWAKWIKNEADEKAVLRGCFFDIETADRAAGFFPRFLKHSKGQWAGKPFNLLPWQEDGIIKPLFGWKRPDGYRRFRTAYIEIPKKNGKSTICAGISLLLLSKDNEPGAEVFSAAADTKQAAIVYKEAVSMVKKSPPLNKRLNIVPSQKIITFEATDSFYQVLSADAYTKEGLNIHGLLFDELHAQKTRDLWDTLVFGGAARRQPLLIAITTAGFDRQSICWEQHEYARQILEGTIEDQSFFAFILGADEEKDDWKDPKVWERVNPSLGITIDREAFEADFRAALEVPRKQNAFKRYHLNIWTNAESRWLTRESWNACGVEEYDGDLMEKLKGLKCWAGVDLSQTRDLTACGLVFEPDEDGIEHTLVFSWIPEEALQEHVERDKVPYDLWHKQGWIETTGGNVTDYDYIAKKILELKEQFPLMQVVGYDPWNAMQWAINLEKEGVPVCPIRQGPKTFAPVCTWFENVVMGKTLRHDNNPVLTWAVDNIVLRYDENENMAPSKKRSIQRIDPAVALLNAKATQFDFEEEEPSVYETRGVLAV